MRRITWLYTLTSLINFFIKRAIFMETYMPLIEQLKELTHESVRDVKEKHVGIAFSGGVDSSVLAKVCENESKNTTLLTVGFASRRDIKISNEVSGELDLELVNMFIPLGELEKGLQEVLSIIEFDRIARLENSVCFYYVFQLAVRQGLDTVLSANGIDELFCGYDVYRRRFGDEDSMISLTESLVKTAKEDKEEIDKVSASFGIKYICPFLSDDFVDFAMEVPLDFKIRGENDNIRKHIWREAALEIGIPRFAALRAKRAFQYSSGVHKAIRKLATKKGFTKKKARSEGFRSRTEAYISNLK